jgi:hypothetical protein
MRVRLALERASPEELAALLEHALARAGAPKLMSAEVRATLCDHAQGNPRTLMNMAGELLALTVSREARQIDEQLFFETFAAPSPPSLALELHARAARPSRCSSRRHRAKRRPRPAPWTSASSPHSRTPLDRCPSTNCAHAAACATPRSTNDSPLSPRRTASAHPRRLSARRPRLSGLSPPLATNLATADTAALRSVLGRLVVLGLAAQPFAMLLRAPLMERRLGEDPVWWQGPGCPHACGN